MCVFTQTRVKKVILKEYFDILHINKGNRHERVQVPFVWNFTLYSADFFC